jgi:calcineurin-like phosphoesterase family protein
MLLGVSLYVNILTMKNTYIISDTHFGHDNIRKHCDRPWKTVEEMNDALVHNWNSMVNNGDIVYHLGDFAMFPRQEDNVDRMKIYRKLRMRLNGKIVLIQGNHDKMSHEVYRDCFSDVHDIYELKFFGEKIVLCHYPLRTWNASFHGRKHLFGHVHGRLNAVENTLGLSMDVGVDVPEWKYSPVPIETILDKLNKKYEYLKSIGYFNKNRGDD